MSFGLISGNLLLAWFVFCVFFTCVLFESRCGAEMMEVLATVEGE